jgi:hypothetical protein
MSSHHIVRENQEPALFIQDPDALAFEKIQELLEWSPTVIVPYRHVATVGSWGIKLDVILCLPHDLEAARELLVTQMPLKLLSVNTRAEEFATAMSWLKRGGYRGLYVISHDAAIFDFSLWPPDFDVELFQQGRRWLHWRSDVFQKWYAAGVGLELRSSTGIERLSTNTDGLFSILRKGPLWIGEKFSD